MKKTKFLDSYDEWIRKRNRVVVLTALVPPIFLLISILMVHFFGSGLPRIVRFYAYGIAVIVGIALAGPKGMRNSTYSEEQLLWGYSMLVTGSVGVLVACYLFSQVFPLGTTTDTTSFIFYSFGLILPILMTVDFLTYEILDSRRNKREMVLRLKRTGARILFSVVFSSAYLLVFIPLSRLVSAIDAMMLTGLIVTIGMGIFVLQFGESIKDFFNGEW